MPVSREWAVAVEAVHAASAVCSKVQAAIGPTLEKGDKSPVTVADYASQAIICRRLKEAFPADAILAEEHSLDLIEGKAPGLSAKLVELLAAAGAPGATLADICGWIDAGRTQGGARRVWILDPIDGTKGFLRREQYAVALGLMVDGVLEYGFLGCPNIAYDEGRNGCLFAARRGHGAVQMWLGDLSVSKPIKVSSGVERFVESVEADHADHAAHHKLCQAVGVTGETLRMDSQAKYAVVARGEASAYLRLSPDPKYRQKVWDHAAGCLIVTEAGGTVTDADGKPLDFTTGDKMTNNLGVVVSNGVCHAALLKAISA